MAREYRTSASPYGPGMLSNNNREIQRIQVRIEEATGKGESRLAV